MARQRREIDMKRTCNGCLALSKPEWLVGRRCELGYSTMVVMGSGGTEKMPIERCPRPITIEAFVKAKKKGEA